MLLFKKQQRKFNPVFIGYGLKTGQGFYPGPIFLPDYRSFGSRFNVLNPVSFQSGNPYH